MSEHPIAFGALIKGDVISADEIEKATKTERGTDQYRWAVLGLIEQIRERRDDLEVHLRCERHTIVVMTDEEAEEWSWSEIRRLQKAIFRIIRRRASLVRTGFDTTRLAVSEARDRYLTRSALETRKIAREHAREVRLLKDDNHGQGQG